VRPRRRSEAATALDSEVLPEGDIEVGTLQDASAAVARLLSVTHASYERRAQLEHALESRIVIEQAKGIVAERYGLEVDEAFDLIRRAARSNRMKLYDLVRAIHPAQETPPELEALIRQEKRV
jgi:hypothetical protein